MAQSREFRLLLPYRLRSEQPNSGLVFRRDEQMEEIVQVLIGTLTDLAVLECEGEIVSMEDALRLRYAVMSRSTPVIIMDVTEVTAIEGEGLEMLSFLRLWTVAHDMRLRLYNPSPSVRARLQQTGCISEITTLDEMVGLVVDLESVFATAA